MKKPPGGEPGGLSPSASSGRPAKAEG